MKKIEDTLNSLMEDEACQSWEDVVSACNRLWDQEKDKPLPTSELRARIQCRLKEDDKLRSIFVDKDWIQEGIKSATAYPTLDKCDLDRCVKRVKQLAMEKGFHCLEDVFGHLLSNGL